jgi:plasmid maintenance system antidote protein VapI
MRKRKPLAFAAALEHLLDQQEISQAELARRIECSEMHVSNLVRGTRDATPELINVIAKKFRLSPRSRVKLHRAAAIDKGFALAVREVHG